MKAIKEIRLAFATFPAPIYPPTRADVAKP
jgi:hypothetical protein